MKILRGGRVGSKEKRGNHYDDNFLSVGKFPKQRRTISQRFSFVSSFVKKCQ